MQLTRVKIKKVMREKRTLRNPESSTINVKRSIILNKIVDSNNRNNIFKKLYR